MIKRIHVLLVLLFLKLSAFSQSWDWKSVNLQGMGYVTGLVIHPNTAIAPNLIYARTDVGGVYRFDSAKNSWIQLLDMIPMGRELEYNVESVAVDPNSADNVYIAVDGYTWGDLAGEVYSSSDKGKSWKATGLKSKNVYIAGNDLYRGGTGERLMVDPNNSKILYFASRKDGLWKYDGTSWNKVSGGLPQNTTYCRDLYGTCHFPGLTFVLFDKNSGTVNGATKRIYVGNHDLTNNTGGVWMSNDAGASWTQIGFDKNTTRATLGGDGTLYVSFGGSEHDWNGPGAVRRYNTDGSWKDISPATNITFTGIAVDPSNPNTIMVTSHYAVMFRSANKGDNWSSVNKTYSNAPSYFPSKWYEWGTAALVIDPNNTKKVWATNGFAVTSTNDITSSSSTWFPVMQNFEEMCGNIIKTPPVQEGAALFTGGGDMGGFVHTDKTVIPTSRIDNTTDDLYWLTGMDYSQKQPSNIAYVGFNEYNHSSMGAYSSDNGKSWTKFATNPAGKAGVIALSATNPTNMVWAPNGNSVAPHFTKDKGLTWTKCNSLPNYTFHRQVDNWGGQTLASDRVNGSKFYYLSQGANNNKSFWVSTDGGQNWSSTAAQFQGNPFSVNPMMKVHPYKEGDIWLSFKQANSKLFHSTDGGNSFSVVNSVNVCNNITFGKGDSNDKPYIFIHGRVGEVAKDGIYKSGDLGLTWELISIPDELQFGNPTYMEGDLREKDLVYIANGCRGFVYGQPNAITALDNNFAKANENHYLSYMGNNDIKINVLAESVERIDIVDLHGKLMMSETRESLQAKDGIINTSMLIEGLYLARFQFSNGVIRAEKFLK